MAHNSEVEGLFAPNIPIHDLDLVTELEHFLGQLHLPDLLLNPLDEDQGEVLEIAGVNLRKNILQPLLIFEFVDCKFLTALNEVALAHQFLLELVPVFLRSDGLVVRFTSEKNIKAACDNNV